MCDLDGLLSKTWNSSFCVFSFLCILLEQPLESIVKDNADFESGMETLGQKKSFRKPLISVGSVNKTALFFKENLNSDSLLSSPQFDMALLDELSDTVGGRHFSSNLW